MERCFLSMNGAPKAICITQYPLVSKISARSSKAIKHKQKGHADRENDGLQFWAIDLHAAYEELKKFQTEHQGTDNMIGVRKNMEQTCTAFAN